MQVLIETLRVVLSSPGVLVGWAVLAIICAGWTAWDLATRNRPLGGLMKVVWVLTVLYSGPIGLAIYVSTGRGQISRDSLWRKSFRSVAHCYSGCGLGEIIGVTLAVGLFAFGNPGTVILTFACAWLIGFAFTVGPLVNGGQALASAVKDTIVVETLSITVMEGVAISSDLYLAEGAGLAEPLFWGSLAFSLSLGLFAAYPVNIGLIALGYKEGMHDPRHMVYGHE